MNHLHHWLEWASEHRSRWRDVVSGSICFTMPHFDEIRNLTSQIELMRAPYRKCWFEGLGPTALYALPEFRHKLEPSEQCSYGTIGFYIAENPDTGNGESAPDGFAVKFFSFHNREWIEGWNELFFDRKEGKWFARDVDDEDGNTRLKPVSPDGDMMDLNVAYCDWISSFLTLLNCSNIRRIEHSPSEALQKARTRRGKLPLFSYWTLEINTFRSPPAENKGGSHASPRLHLRRGHPRQYALEKWCWVNPHAVGNKKLGIVHKDYSIANAERLLAQPCP